MSSSEHRRSAESSASAPPPAPAVVIGEALIDLVLVGDGLTVEAALGGAPFNAARAAARLGASVEFVGALGTDRFGRALAAQLIADGVGVRWAPTVDRPTTLALAELADGAARYRFYIDGTSAPELRAIDLDIGLGGSTGDVGTPSQRPLVLTGGLALVLEPMATTVLDTLASLPPEVVVVVDVNCRPLVVPDRDRYVADVLRAVGRADVVKVSDEDLAYLFPDLDEGDDEGEMATLGADRLLAAGAHAVLVTAGADHTAIVTAAGTTNVPVPTLRAPVVDTIGAGDTFIGGVAAALVAGRFETAGGIEVSKLESAVDLGHAAAGVVVTRRGADPPTLGDITAEVETPD